MATASRRMRPVTSSQPTRRTEERGHGYVRTSVSDRQGVYHEEDREVEVLRAKFSEEDPPAFVKVSAGLTINMGNFESLRVDCAVTLPCKRTDLEAAYRTASDFVSERVSEEQTAWLGAGNQKARGKGR
jgi:hypothetical protein